jgi:hypothetical protein
LPWTTRDVSRFKKGLTKREKERWVSIANSALERCLANGGSQSNCEASAIRQASGSVGNNLSILMFSINNYEIRYETHQNREHIVVPVIMMVDGVHNGSAGALLHTSEEYGRYPGSWDGIPIAIMHPKQDGDYVSANSPQIIDSQTIGRIYNTTCNGKLKAECWIDVMKAEKTFPEVLEDIKDGKPIQVSVGVFTDDESTSGTWEGEEYIAIARNHRPDHLALLPGSQGACSFDDGCGIRANEEGGEGKLKEVKVDKSGEKQVTTNQDDSQNQTIEIKDYVADNGKEIIEILSSSDEGISALLKRLNRGGYSFVQFNEAGYKEICRNIQLKLDNMDTDTKYHYLEEVFDVTI